MDVFKYINSNISKLLFFNIVNNNNFGCENFEKLQVLFNTENNCKKLNEKPKVLFNIENNTIQIHNKNKIKKFIGKKFNRSYKLNNINSIKDYFNKNNINLKITKRVEFKNENDLKIYKSENLYEAPNVTVYKIVENNVEYVIKQITKNQNFKLKKIKKEILIQSYLSNYENFVNIRDFYKIGNNYYIKMDYFENGDASNLVYDNIILNKFQKYKIYCQLINCVKIMHENNIVHRDIKPENIYLDHDYNAFLGDFGESIIYKENKNKKYDINTNMFSLPNQYVKLFSKGNLDIKMNLLKNDIYALGLTILSIECNTISPDIDDIDNIDEFINIRDKFIKDNLNIIDNYNNDLSDLLTNMLSNNIEEIPTIEDIINSEFFQ